MEMTKRILSLLLAVVMLCAMLPHISTEADATSNMNTAYRNANGYEFAIFPLGGDFHFTQLWNDTYSHVNQLAVDCLPLTSAGGINYSASLYAPFTGKIVASYSSWGCVVFQSNAPVQYADGTVDIMTVVFGHDNNSETYTKNVTVKQGEKLCAPGTAGGSAYHTHIFVVKGTWEDWVNGGYKAAGQSYVNSGGGNIIPVDAFFLDTDWTDDWTQSSKSCYYPQNKVNWITLKSSAAQSYKCNHNYNNLGICTSTCKQAYDWEATFDDDCAGIYKVSLSGGVYLRTDKPYAASTAKSKLIKEGTQVQVLGSVTNAFNHIWYKVSYNGVVGYTSEDNLTLVPHTCDKGTYMYYEEVHPHRSCYKCSICGKIWAEAGSTNKMPSCQQCAASSEHTCNKGTYMYYEEVHPHRSCYKCSVCGKIWAVDGSTNKMPSCVTCQKPGKPVLTNLSGKTFQENESVTFTWAATSNTTHYNLYMQHKNASGQWEKYDQLFYVSSGMKLTFPVNEYRCYIQSYNSNCWAADGSDWLYTEGDFTYFTVVPADHLPTAVCDEVTGKENSVYVRGWAFDSDTPSKSLDIHVYIDGVFAGAGTANGSRPDVNNVYGCGNNHGFAFSVPYKVSTTGKHSVEVYALNTASGKNHRLMGPFNVTITAHTHTYTSQVTTAATCVKNGTKTYTCSGCSSSYTETIPATGEHSWDAGKITTEATCATEGVRTYYCYHCDATKQETIDKTTGHLYNIKEVAPTCVEDGYDGYICVRCGYIEIVVVRPATGQHTWAFNMITKRPTCATEGVRTYCCRDCNATKTEPIAATGEHQYEDGFCIHCDAEDPERWFVLGDFTDDNVVTNEDVIYLLWHSLFPDTYPVDSQADFTRDGQVTNEDVIYLLWHTLFPESYPLGSE